MDVIFVTLLLQKRMEEARALQEKIKAKKAEKQAMEDEAEKHQKVLNLFTIPKSNYMYS